MRPPFDFFSLFVSSLTFHSVFIRRTNKMARLLIFVGGTLFGWIGWWLGTQISSTVAYIISGLGTLLGIYIGWRIHRDYLY